MTNGLQIIVSLLRDIANSLKNSGGTKKIEEKLQSIIDASVVTNISLDGWSAPSELNLDSVGKLIMNLDKITEINDYSIREFFQHTTYFPFTNLKKASFHALERVNIGANASMRSSANLIEFYAENLTYQGSGEFLEGCTNLRKVYIPNVNYNNKGFYGDNNLIDITIGAAMTSSFALPNWSPTNALSATMRTLVDDGEPFTSNLEKLLYNIREHIAKNLPNRNGMSALTITFSSEVKAAILADTTTTLAFTSKNWTIA